MSDETSSSEQPSVMPVAPVEAWAEAKGHVVPAPRHVQGALATKAAVVLDWRFAATKAHEQWPAGVELTEAEYDAAVARSIGVALR